MRDLVARMKLIPIRELIDGKRLLFCEDSIVRGHAAAGHDPALFDYGAKEVHMRPACPPDLRLQVPELLPLPLQPGPGRPQGDPGARGAEDRHLDEYARHGSEKHLAMIDRIGERLGLTTLKYQRLDDMVEAIGLPKERLCTYCWDGTSYT